MLSFCPNWYTTSSSISAEVLNSLPFRQSQIEFRVITCDVIFSLSSTVSSLEYLLIPNILNFRLPSAVIKNSSWEIL